METQRDRETGRQIDWKTERQTGRQTARQTDRQVERQKDKQTQILVDRIAPNILSLTPLPLPPKKLIEIKNCKINT